MRLEQAYQLFAGRHRLAVKDAPLALSEDALDQRQIMAELGAPALGRDPGEVGEPFAGLVPRRLGGAGGGDQLTIEPAPVVFAAAVLNRARAFCQAAAIPPPQLPRFRPCRRLPQLAARAAS